MNNKPMFFRPTGNRDLAKGVPIGKNNEEDIKEPLESIHERIIGRYKQLSNEELNHFHQKKLGVIINSSEEAKEHLLATAINIQMAKHVEQKLNEFMLNDINDVKHDVKPEEDTGEEEQGKGLQLSKEEEGEEGEDDVRQKLNDIKNNLEEFLDRLTIVESRCDDTDEKLGNIDLNMVKVGVEIAKVSSFLTEYSEKMDTLDKKFEDMDKNKGNGLGGNGEIIVRYQDPLKEKKKLKGIVNKEFKKAIELTSSRVNVLLTGPSGCGKTHMSAMVAEALGLRFGSQSCSEGMDESVFSGSLLPTGDGGTFEYIPSLFIDFYENGGLFLIDEGDAADSNLMITPNSALSNDSFHLPRRWLNPLVKRHPDFVCIMATNTIGHGGDDTYLRNQLDGATLDRFRAGIIKMDYSENVEKALVDEEVYTWCELIRRGINELNMPRIMSTRVMLDFTKLKIQQNWPIKTMSESYFMDWRKDDKNRLDGWMKSEMEKLRLQIAKAGA